jgi:hypothetical protein
MDPATISLIVGLVIQGGRMGYNYYEATQYALKQESIQRSILEANQAQIAIAMHDQFPNVTFDEWLSIIKNSVESMPQDQTLDGKSTDWTKYAPYIAIGGIFLLIVYIQSR